MQGVFITRTCYHDVSPLVTICAGLFGRKNLNLEFAVYFKGGSCELGLLSRGNTILTIYMHIKRSLIPEAQSDQIFRFALYGYLRTHSLFMHPVLTLTGMR